MMQDFFSSTEKKTVVMKDKGRERKGEGCGSLPIPLCENSEKRTEPVHQGRVGFGSIAQGKGETQFVIFVDTEFPER